MVNEYSNSVVFQLVAEVIGIDAAELSMQSNMYNTEGWDSFSHVELLLRLSERYGIEINEESIEHYTSLSNIFHLVEGE